MKVAIVGGGISGLATAYYLLRKNPALEVRVFEAGSHCGGLLETVRSSAALMECGPDAIFNEKPWALELCRELGLEPEMIPTGSEHRRSFILNRQKLFPIPAGFYLTAPRTLSAWWNLPGMSLGGKLRMLGDLFLPAKKGDQDESVADFVTRRFGKETLEKLAQPMIAGVYTSKPEILSLLATFPQFRTMEKKHGSIIRALALSKNAKGASGPRYGLFSSLKNGMGSWPEKLEKELAGEIEVFARVQKIVREEDQWVLKIDHDAYEADAVCLAVPSHQAARILAESCPDIAAQLGAIRFEPVATINYLLPRRAVQHPLNGFGFVVPAAEKSSLIGCSFSHQKFEGRVTSADTVLLRAFVGGAYGHEIFKNTDEEITEKVLLELKTILGITSKPLQTLIRRYDLGMPQYEVGHVERMNQLFENVARYPGLFLTGLSYRGIGIPDCVREAGLTAEKILSFLKSSAFNLPA